MRIELPPRGTASRWIEPAFACANIAGVIYTMWFLRVNEYLPAPFLRDVRDTFMDWVNPAYWSHDLGTFDVYRTIYPPLSYVFLWFAGFPSCYKSDALFARDCDWPGLVLIHLFYLLSMFVAAKTFMKLDRRTALCRSIGFGMGLPLLFALERGNLLLVCFPCFAIAYGPLVRSARLRWVAAGLTVNFKVYLIAPMFAHLLRRRWRVFEGCLLATFAIYMVSYGIMGRGSIPQIYSNVRDFSEAKVSVNFLDLWYTNTFQSLLSIFDGPFPSRDFFGSRLSEGLLYDLPLILHLVQVGVVAACAAAWLRPEVVPNHRLACLTLLLALITSETGGYTQIFVVYLVFMERWRTPGRVFSIVCAYILCIPFDYAVMSVNPLISLWSFLGQSYVTVEYGITVGPLLRPVMLWLISISLSLVTMRDVWADIRAQGWKQRRRFRHDFPLLLGPGRDAGGATARPVRAS